MATLIACPKCSAKVSQVYTLCPECFSPIPKESSANTAPSKPGSAAPNKPQYRTKKPNQFQLSFPWMGIAALAMVLIGGTTMAVKTFSLRPPAATQESKPGVEAALAVTTEPVSGDEQAPNARQRIKIAGVALRNGEFELARNQAETALNLLDNQLDTTASEADLKECHRILQESELTLKHPEVALYHCQWLWNSETQHSPEQATHRSELVNQVENSWLGLLRTASQQSNKALRLNHLRDLFQGAQNLGLFEKPEVSVRKELASAHLDAAHLSAELKDYVSARIFLSNAQIYGRQDPALAKALSNQPQSTALVAESRPAYSVTKLEQPKPKTPTKVKVYAETNLSYPVALRHANGTGQPPKKPGRVNPDAEMEALQEQMHKQAPPKQPIAEAPKPRIQLPEIKVEAGSNSNSIPGYYGSSRARDTLPGY